MKKMSYVSAIDVVLSGAEVTDEVRERLEALKGSLAKRSAYKSSQPTKAQRERAAVADKVLSAMEPNVVYGSADVASLIPELAGATPQKITALMKSLGGSVTTSKVKGKAYYSLA